MIASNILCVCLGSLSASNVYFSIICIGVILVIDVFLEQQDYGFGHNNYSTNRDVSSRETRRGNETKTKI